MITVPIDLQKLRGKVNKEVVKNTQFNVLNTKVNNSDKNSSCIYFSPVKSMQHR